MSSVDGKIRLSVIYLKELRKQCGLSQEKLACIISKKNINLSISTIKRAEAGKSVNYNTAYKLAEFYNVDVIDLYAK